MPLLDNRKFLAALALFATACGKDEDCAQDTGASDQCDDGSTEGTAESSPTGTAEN
jgi:hypothetical protein